MTNIVVLCHGRHQLTMQCINSIRMNTKRGEYTLTIVSDDEKDFRVSNFLRDQVLHNPKDTTMVAITGGNHCLGALKNLGISHSRMTFGAPDYLCVLDNDVCMFQSWLNTLIEKYDGCKMRMAILGGVRHPYHQSNAYIGSGVDLTDAVAGYCHFLSWEAHHELTKDLARREYTHLYVADAPGIGQSEDFEVCQRAKSRGAEVGYVNPPVMAHCGITNSKGEPIAGAELIERIPGVMYL